MSEFTSVNSVWTDKELNCLRVAINQRIPISILAQGHLQHRSLDAIKNKLRKLRKKENYFGLPYQGQKNSLTAELCKTHKPSTVFEGYAGTGNQTIIWAATASKVISCEKDHRKFDLLVNRLIVEGGFKISSTTDDGKIISLERGKKALWLLNMDHVVGACHVFNLINDQRVDLVDLDPYGSTVLTMSHVLLILKPTYFLITHGEIQLLRFKRSDAIARLVGRPDVFKKLPNWAVQQFMKVIDDVVNNELLLRAIKPKLLRQEQFGKLENFNGIRRSFYKLSHLKASHKRNFTN